MDKQALINELDRLKQDSKSMPDNYMIYNSAIVVAKEVIENMIPTIRPEIMEFAIEMEKEMARHDAEKGDSWKKCDIDNLEYGLLEANIEWQYKFINGEIDISHYIDIANYAMMIWHKAKGE